MSEDSPQAAELCRYRGIDDAPRAVARRIRDTVVAFRLRATDRWRKDGGPLAVFLPATDREGAALLRIYEVASALPSVGWRAIVIPPRTALAGRRSILLALAPDVVVMQGSRHPLNRPRKYDLRCPIIYDLDDADFHLPHLAGPVADAVPQVAAVAAGSAYIADWCRAAGAARAQVVWTGARVSPRRPSLAGRGDVIAWAQSRPMTYVREAALVCEAVARIGRRRPVTLRLFDRLPSDDSSFAESFLSPGVTVDWRPRMAYAAYLDALRDVAVGLAPLCPETSFSRGKSFGKVLGYLDAGVVVVASDTGEHPRFFDGRNGALVGSAEEMAAAALGYLCDAPARTRTARAGRDDFAARLSTAAATAKLAKLMSEVCAAGKMGRAAATG